MFRGISVRCGCWLRALAGALAGVGLAGIGALLLPPGAHVAASHTAAPRAGGLKPSASIALVSAVSLAAAQPDSATLTPATMLVTAGVATQFSFTFTAILTFKGGVVTLQVPTASAGWPDPTAAPAGSQGFTSVASTGPNQPIWTIDGATITVTDIALRPGQAITVSYLATAPQPTSPPSEISSFSATAQQFSDSVMQSLATQVTVMSPVSASTSPASSSVSPVSASVSAGTGRGGSGSHVPVSLVLGPAAAVAAAALLAWRLVRRRTVPVSAQNVRAVSHAGAPVQLNVHKTGTEPTRTVRIEPHPDVGSTTIQELEP
jgi:hypothetical protein